MHYVANIPFPRSEYVQTPWLTPTLPPPFDPATAIGGFAGAANQRARAHRVLDVRHVVQLDTTWTAQISEVLAPSSFDRRSRNAAILDVRKPVTHDQPWLKETLPVGFDPTVLVGGFQLSQLVRAPIVRMPPPTEFAPVWTGPNFPANWPQIEQLAGSFRVRSSRQARAEEPSTSWFPALNFDPVGWPQIEQLMRSFRVRAAGVQRVDDPNTSWLYPNLPAPGFDPANWPSIEQLLRADRTGSAPKRQIDDPGLAWLFTNLPVLGFDPANWPQIEQLLRSYRAGAPAQVRPDLDEPLFTWSYPLNEVLASSSFDGRTLPAAKLDVRKWGPGLWPTYPTTPAPGISPGDEVQVMLAPIGTACTVLADSGTPVRVVIDSAKQIHVLTEGGTPIKVTI